MTTDVFEAQRPRLFAIAYRMLGSVTEAEDAVQDTWIAWQRAPRAEGRRSQGLPDAAGAAAAGDAGRRRGRRGGRVGAHGLPRRARGPVARFLAGIAARAPAARIVPTTVNGAPGAVIGLGDDLLGVASVDVEDGAVRRVHLVRNPDKLRHVEQGAAHGS